MKRSALPTAAAYALPFVLILLLLAIYLISPTFYLTYVLELQMREYQAVEMVTFSSSLLGSLLLLYGASRLWRRLPERPSERRGLWNAFDHHFVWLFPATLGLAAFFFAGEEVNWGQTFLHWGVAENAQDRSTILNLHNTTQLISIQSLGSVFIIVCFVVVPGLWLMRRRLNLPAAWAPAIPWGPACVTAIVGSVWSKFKEIYVRFSAADIENDAFYWGFAEQIGEQKEMLFAVAMLLAGAHLVWRVRQTTR